MSQTPNLVATHWLAQHLDDPAVVVLDGSWHMPAEKRDPTAEFLAGHIPGAQFFDINKIADTSQNLPHMLASPSDFTKTVSAMGVGDASHIVVYDAVGLLSAARVWWNFRAMGAHRVSVLDGGLPRWKAEGRPLEAGPARRRQAPTAFTPRPNYALVRGLAEVRAAVASGAPQIVDARGAGRFTGAEPEPRPGLASGHMPGARNVPHASIVAGGALKSPPELRAAFEAAGLDLSKPVIASCGSGISAAILALALREIGAPDAAVYDGSWAEWGRDDANPVAKGPA